MFNQDNLFGNIIRASQQINLGETPAHIIELREKELFLHLWQEIKALFHPDLDVFGRLKAFCSMVYHLLSYPIFQLDSQPVSIFNIITGIFLLLISFKYARLISNKLTHEFVKLTSIDKTSEEAIKKIVYYFTVVILTILILDISHVPITIFTLLGGALAIGFGLGTQNIANDFISGLIIMMERPFKIGDTIEVDKFSGSVQQIGTRCTFIKDSDQRSIMVPNSKLLTTNVVNCSLRGDLVNCTNSIPVEHGSEVVLVTEIIEKALLQHPYVNNDTISPPKAFLTNITEKSLNFELSFYYNQQEYDKREILHQLYSRILGEFNKYGINLARGKKVVIHDQIAANDEDDEDDEEEAGES